MTLANALVALFTDKLGSPQYDGDVSNSTKAQFDAIKWNDSRDKPSWTTVQAKMAENLLVVKTVEERLAALETDVTTLKAR